MRQINNVLQTNAIRLSNVCWPARFFRTTRNNSFVDSYIQPNVYHLTNMSIGKSFITLFSV